MKNDKHKSNLITQVIQKMSFHSKIISSKLQKTCLVMKLIQWMMMKQIMSSFKISQGILETSLIIDRRDPIWLVKAMSNLSIIL